MRSSSRCSGVGSSGVCFSRPAMRPISVRMPVAVTTAAPVPVGGGGAAEHHVVAIAERRVAVDRRRCPSRPAGSRRSARLRRSAAPPIRRGARRRGSCRLPRSSMMSPGTIVGGGDAPPLAVAHDRGVGRRHRAQRGDGGLGARLLHVAHRRVEQDDREDRDRFVGQRRVALDRATATAEIAVATSSRMTRTSWNCARKRRQAGTGGSAASSLRPSRSRRRRASSSPRPC